MRDKPDPGAGFEESLSRARTLDREGEPAQAADHYRRALEARPDHVATRIALGRALLACDDAARARQELFLALQHDPDQMVARRLLADANLALHDDLEAHRWLVEYLRVVPEDDEARRLLADIEPRLREAPQKATRTLGELYLEQGHARQAAKVFAGLLEKAPDDRELRVLADRADRARAHRRQTALRLLARLRAWHQLLERMTV